MVVRRLPFGMWLLAATAILSLLPAHALARGRTDQNCSIHIRTRTRSGEKTEQTFKTRLSSRNECERLAKFHRPNFNPYSVADKHVSYRWTPEGFAR